MLKRLLTIAIIAFQCTLAALSSESGERAVVQLNTSVESAANADGITVNGPIVTITNTSTLPCIYNVYCVTGQTIKVVRLGAGAHTSFELPKGFYVVKCNNEWSRKIIVR